MCVCVCVCAGVSPTLKFRRLFTSSFMLATLYYNIALGANTNCEHHGSGEKGKELVHYLIDSVNDMLGADIVREHP